MACPGDHRLVPFGAVTRARVGRDVRRRVLHQDLVRDERVAAEVADGDDRDVPLEELRRATCVVDLEAGGPRRHHEVHAAWGGVDRPGLDETLEVEGLRPEARPLCLCLVGGKVEVERGAESFHQQEDQRAEQDEADYGVAKTVARALPSRLGPGVGVLGLRRGGGAGTRWRGRHRSSSGDEAATTRSTARVRRRRRHTRWTP